MSSSAPTTGISLADLPPDLVRFIVPMTESPHQLKYISPIWNVITEEYLARRNPLPIDKAHICITGRSVLKIGLVIQTKCLHHFGIEKWAKAIEHANNEAHVYLPPQSILGKNNSKNSNEEKTACLRLKRFFKMCSFIDRIEISNAEPASLEIIFDILDSVPIGLMEVRGNYHIRDASVRRYSPILKKLNQLAREYAKRNTVQQAICVDGDAVFRRDLAP